MTRPTPSMTPGGRTGWIAVALGFAVLAVLLPVYLVSSALTNGGSESGPTWLPVVAPLAILVVAIPAIVMGFRARRADPSVLGTVALVIACVVGFWFTFTGLAHLFIE